MRFSLKRVATFQIWTKIAGTLQEDGLGTVMGTDRSVQWTNKQLTKRPALCKITTGSTTSRHVRERHKKCIKSIYTRYLELFLSTL